jgi:hypothetical protein
LTRIKPDIIELLHAASRPFSSMNGSREVMHVMVMPIAVWFNSKVPTWSEGQKESLLLQGVPFGLIALLALDMSCLAEYSEARRVWTFTFRESQDCAKALEVKFLQHANDNERRVGITMTYNHATPGELTVEIIPACPDECASAAT